MIRVARRTIRLRSISKGDPQGLDDLVAIPKATGGTMAGVEQSEDLGLRGVNMELGKDRTRRGATTVRPQEDRLFAPESASNNTGVHRVPDLHSHVCGLFKGCDVRPGGRAEGVATDDGSAFGNRHLEMLRVFGADPESNATVNRGFPASSRMYINCSRGMFPVRSPTPRKVPLTMVAPASTAASAFASARPLSL